MGEIVIERTKKDYLERKNEIKSAKYDCDANLERIFQDIKLLK
jgi:hypothetical protein